MKMTTRMLVALAVLCCVGSAAIADDLAPPTWRGQPGSTFQKWEFPTDSSPAAPTASANDYGTPSALIAVGGLGAGWLDLDPMFGNKQGFWDIGTGSIALTIPNRPTTDPLSYKEIQIQFTFYKDWSQTGTVSIVPGATQVGTTVETLVEEVPLFGAWWSSKSVWRIEPNPDSETITILANQEWGTLIDEIVVDTKCTLVPEPGGLAALGTGLMAIGGAFWRRRRGS